VWSVGASWFRGYCLHKRATTPRALPSGFESSDSYRCYQPRSNSCSFDRREWPLLQLRPVPATITLVVAPNLIKDNKLSISIRYYGFIGFRFEADDMAVQQLNVVRI
jgi:hypothetical protein